MRRLELRDAMLSDNIDLDEQRALLNSFQDGTSCDAPEGSNCLLPPGFAFSLVWCNSSDSDEEQLEGGAKLSKAAPCKPSKAAPCSAPPPASNELHTQKLSCLIAHPDDDSGYESEELAEDAVSDGSDDLHPSSASTTISSSTPTPIALLDAASPTPTTPHRRAAAHPVEKFEASGCVEAPRNNTVTPRVAHVAANEVVEPLSVGVEDRKTGFEEKEEEEEEEEEDIAAGAAELPLPPRIRRLGSSAHRHAAKRLLAHEFVGGLRPTRPRQPRRHHHTASIRRMHPR